LGTAKPILRVLRGQLQCRRPGFLAKHTSQRFRCKGALAIGELHHRLFTPDGCALGLYLEYSRQRRPNGARRNGLAVVRLRAALRPGNSKEQLHIRRWQLARASSALARTRSSSSLSDPAPMAARSASRVAAVACLWYESWLRAA
jgi:hypothetical protein